jgi:hypothetical protein
MPMPSLQDAISLYGPTGLSTGIFNQQVAQGGQQFDQDQAIKLQELIKQQLDNQITQGSMPDKIAHQGAVNAQLLGQASSMEASAQATKNENSQFPLKHEDYLKARKDADYKRIAERLRIGGSIDGLSPEIWLDDQQTQSGLPPKFSQAIVDTWRTKHPDMKFSDYLNESAKTYMMSGEKLGAALIGERKAITTTGMNNRTHLEGIAQTNAMKMAIADLKLTPEAQLAIANNPAALAKAYDGLASKETPGTSAYFTLVGKKTYWEGLASTNADANNTRAQGIVDISGATEGAIPSAKPPARAASPLPVDRSQAAPAKPAAPSQVQNNPTVAPSNQQPMNKPGQVTLTSEQQKKIDSYTENDRAAAIKWANENPSKPEAAAIKDHFGVK